MLTGGWYEANLGFGRCAPSYIPLKLDKAWAEEKERNKKDE